ncbi:hypothetical protein [Tenacibaculum jejuense]|uniref:Lipoprotein n=1 Tax=Tenacibaculum jejuense TaxID=584609 RepID=A0A238U7H3_9FLAO|nr:hypothetical protein [Tenacibaculum jejuense]SNR15133.1 Protein of unknown function precursor [Tenacibaculum jejuense]
MNNYFRKVAFLMLFLCAGIYGSVSAFEKPSDQVTSIQDEKNLVATFEDYTEEGFKFLLKDGNSMTFSLIADELLESYDLKSDEYKGKLFQITYLSEEKDGEITHKITGLKELKSQEENS